MDSASNNLEMPYKNKRTHTNMLKQKFRNPILIQKLNLSVETVEETDDITNLKYSRNS